MPAIEVSHLTKEYRLGALQGLKQTLLNTGARLTGRPVPERRLFKALDDVSFTIEQGEVVGIIGHNGAGKSTLLKILAKITSPTSGSVDVRGRIVPMIEVGAGFVPDFTGRENVYLNGAILGMSRQEIDRRFDEIVDFSELSEFIDTPVKRYSSGMQVKLAFAVATSVESEILIVDEVLAVGDLAFQRKCFDRIEENIKRCGKTVLIVSHNIRQIERLCSRAIMLDHGGIFQDGDKTAVCETFYRYSNLRISEQAPSSLKDNPRIRRSKEADLIDLKITDEKGIEIEAALTNRPLTIKCKFRITKPIDRPELIVGFHTTDFFYVASMSNGHIDNRPVFSTGEKIVECKIPNLPLMPGVYAIRVGLLDRNSRELFYGEMLKTFPVNASDTPQSKMSQVGIVNIPVEWSFRDINQDGRA